MRTMLALLLLALHALAGCAPHEGIELREWTVADGRRLTLPAHLPSGEGEHRLRAEIPLPPELRGRPLVFTIPYLKGTIGALLVDGSGAAMIIDGTDGTADHTEGGVAFAVPASATTGERLGLEMQIPDRWYGSGWLDMAPRLSATQRGDRRYRQITAWNDVTRAIGVLVPMTLGFVYLLIFIRDRRQQRQLWYALIGIPCGLTLIGATGMASAIFGHAGFAMGWFLLAVATYSGGRFFITHFQLAGTPRVLRLLATLPISGALASFAGVIAPRSQPVALFALPILAAGIAIGLVLFRLMWKGAPDARVMFVGIVIAVTCGALDSSPAMGGGELLGGVHLFPISVAFYALMQAVVVSRDFDRLRVSLEQRIVEVDVANLELKRQVAERSRQLADAFARIGELPERTLTIVVGDVIATRYRVVRLLGEGGMGQVFEVERLVDQRRLALKLLHRATSGEALARFAREAQIGAGASHSGLIQVIDVDVTSTGSLFIVMELVLGGSLEDRRDRFGDGSFARPIFRELVAGVRALHQQGIVHRDLKPANILLDAGDHVKIADFGIAGLVETIDAFGATVLPSAAAPNHLTRTGVAMGTPLYMSPELAAGARAAPASDIWALGIIGHELFSGSHPFGGRPYGVGGRAAADIGDRSIAHVLDRCLETEPDRRPSIEAIAAALA